MGAEDSNGFSHEQRHNLYVIVAVQSIVGIVLNLFTVFTYLRFSELRKVIILFCCDFWMNLFSFSFCIPTYLATSY